MLVEGRGGKSVWLLRLKFIVASGRLGIAVGDLLGVVVFADGQYLRLGEVLVSDSRSHTWTISDRYVFQFSKKDLPAYLHLLGSGTDR